MAALSITIKGNRETFAPGDSIAGEVSWQLDKVPEKIFLRLYWFTSGKGTEDVEVISETVFDYPAAADTRTFEIPLPDSPYSFSGRLVSLTWALELTGKGIDLVSTKEIVMSPYGNAIDLTKIRHES